jgi:flavodoxin I
MNLHNLKETHMNTLIIYDSAFGNTEQLALMLAETLQKQGPVEVRQVPETSSLAFEGTDFLVCGGPTQHHGLSPAMRAWLEGLPRGALQGLRAAAFDTRYHLAAWQSGSAARAIARKLTRAGAWLIVPPESFFVLEREGPLKEGELERAAYWADNIVEQMESERSLRT